MKVCYLLIAAFLSAALFFSCEGDSTSKDNEPPQISGLRISDNDTIDLGDKDTIVINKAGSLIDTLVADQYVKLSVTFTDNQALSSYIVRVDTTLSPPANSTDTAFVIQRSWLSILGKETAVIDRQSVFLVLSDTTTSVDGKPRLLYEGNNYYVKVECVDKAGNAASEVRQVYVMRRETLIEQRKKK